MVLLWPGHRASALTDVLPQGDGASHDGRACSQTPGGMVGITVDGAVPHRVRSWEPSRVQGCTGFVHCQRMVGTSPGSSNAGAVAAVRIRRRLRDRPIRAMIPLASAVSAAPSGWYRTNVREEEPLYLRHLHLPACALALPSPSVPVGLRADERGVDEVLREEPRLELARPDDVGDNQVIGAIITECRDAGRRVVRVAQDQRVRLE